MWQPETRASSLIGDVLKAAPSDLGETSAFLADFWTRQSAREQLAFVETLRQELTLPFPDLSLRDCDALFAMRLFLSFMWHGVRPPSVFAGAEQRIVLDWGDTFSVELSSDCVTLRSFQWVVETDAAVLKSKSDVFSAGEGSLALQAHLQSTCALDHALCVVLKKLFNDFTSCCAEVAQSSQ